MANESNEVHISPAASRREILRAAGAAAIGGMPIAAPVASGSALADSVTGSDPGSSTKTATMQRSVHASRRLQHFRLAVQNMDRAFAFCTEVLGGNEVMGDGDFQGTGARRRRR